MKKLTNTPLQLSLIVVCYTAIITFSRAIRMPNDFSEALWLLDYQFGFMKRGLVGTVINSITGVLGVDVSPNIIVFLSVLVYAAFFSMVVFVFYRMLRNSLPTNTLLLVGIVFASSPFIVKIGHLFGYFDVLLYTLAILAIIFVLKNKPIIASLVSSIAILIHESYLLVGLPLVFLAVIITLSNFGFRGWGRHLAGLAMPVLVFLTLAVLQNIFNDPLVLRSQLADYLNSFGFVSTRADGVALWQTTSFIEFYNQQKEFFMNRLLHPVFLGQMLPNIAFVFVFMHTCFRVKPLSFLSLLLFLVVFIPLSLHIVAWDTIRISSYPVFGSIIAFWILSETRQASNYDSIIWLILLPVLFINIFGRIPLLDDEVERFDRWLRLFLYLPTILFVVWMAFKYARKGWLDGFAAKDA